MKTQMSRIDARKKKLLLALPLLVIPFLTMAFWALGGGKQTALNKSNETGGLNLQLPSPQLSDDKGVDKLSYYEIAQKDSAKRREGAEAAALGSLQTADSSRPPVGSYHPYSPGKDVVDPTEQKVYQKLEAINRQLTATAPTKVEKTDTKRATAVIDKEDVDRLEAMMQPKGEVENDPEVEQLNGMMDRILDIQHPERVAQRVQEVSKQNKRAIYPLQTYPTPIRVSTLGGEERKGPSGFYHGVTTMNDGDAAASIEAVVPESLTLVDGAILKLRTTTDGYLAGRLLPKGTAVWGTVALRGERLEVAIATVRIGTALLPVDLQVVDLDGGQGIYIPGAISRDVAKDAARDATNAMDIGNVDPSITAQLTGAGISTAKALLQRKAKLVKVKVRAGYRVLLQNKTEMLN